MDDERLIEEAACLMDQAKNLVAFSGAGVSEESGIPTFRDPGGLWDRFDPYEMGGGDIFSTLLSGSGPSNAVVDFVSEMVSTLEKAQPNPGHLALGDLEEMGILKAVITQNIDNLHREAGNTHVIEVHGNVYRLACLNCGSKMYLDREELPVMGKKLIELLGKNDLQEIVKLVSRCSCGGVCRLDVVGFGEPVQDLGQAVYEAKNSDLFLILGTSGEVYPASSLPDYARKAGAKLIEINATGTYFPQMVDIAIVGKSGEVLPRIVRRIRELRN